MAGRLKKTGKRTSYISALKAKSEEDKEDAAFLNGRPVRRVHVLENFSFVTGSAKPYELEG